MGLSGGCTLGVILYFGVDIAAYIRKGIYDVPEAAIVFWVCLVLGGIAGVVAGWIITDRHQRMREATRENDTSLCR